MDVLLYNELQPRRNQAQFDRICDMLRQEKFAQAEVKKLTPGRYFRAKLNDSGRLLFCFVRHQQERVILLLEVIYNHEYEKSRFLQGAVIDEGKIPTLPNLTMLKDADVVELVYRNPARQTFHMLDRPLSFDALQEELFHARLPVIIVGSAGSGKTVLSLEKLKTLPGEVLYVTRSAYLAENARRLYCSFGYDNPKQNVDFLAFDEVIQSLRSPTGRMAEFADFQRWLRDQPGRVGFDAHQLHEEFSGVLTGSRVEQAFLSEEDYRQLGVKQSIFSEEEREKVYALFQSYLAYLKSSQLYAETILCHEYLALAEPHYDYLVVDEVQDLTNVQLFLLLKCLKTSHHFLLCGDSNQIVHPNFFSWSAVKSLFFKKKVSGVSAEINILHANYRNSQAVTMLANQLLRMKVARFGSVDKESNFLVNCISERPGAVTMVGDDGATRQELNEKTANSVHFAVLVLRDTEKEAARRVFKTPLVFTVREAKGLEYQNIVIYNLISGCRAEFDEIADGVDAAALTGELRYARNKDKSDKSLEIYKFFINSLYVAVTRAVENLYWLERDGNHRIFRLLNLTSGKDKLKLKAVASSSEEWRKEAAKLEAQGKKEQAERIRHDVLKLVPVPWEVMTRSQLPTLFHEALNPGKYNRQAKQKLLNYAVANGFDLFKTRLQNCGFHFAGKDSDAERQYCSTFHVPYNPGNRKKLLTDLQRYGVDFRDMFNRTPLMMACETGDAALAAQLLEQEANPNLTDNHGFLAFHYLLRRLSRENAAAFFPVYQQLEPSFITVRVGERQLKIGRQSMEFFVLNCILATQQDKLRSKNMFFFEPPKALGAGDIEATAVKLPDFIMPAYRKRRAYISSILSKNERASTNPYGIKLFYRLRSGHYLLNPDLQLSYGGEWLPWDELQGMRYWGYPDHDYLPAAFCILMRRLRRDNDADIHHVYTLWCLVQIAGTADDTRKRDCKEDPFEIISAEQTLAFAGELLDLQADLPPLPTTLDELNKLRGKNHDCPDPLFFTVEKLAEKITTLRSKWHASQTRYDELQAQYEDLQQQLQALKRKPRRKQEKKSVPPEQPELPF